MPRIRTVKPELYFDEELAKLDVMTRYFFIGLFTQADKSGKMEDKPGKLKAQIFPYDKFDPEKSLEKLSKHFITRYEVEGKKYLKINTFLKHQRPHHTEQNSTIPEPNGVTTVVERLENGQEGKGKDTGEGKGKDTGITPNPLKGEFNIPSDLEQTKTEILNWLAYKREKGQAYKGERGLSALWVRLREIPEDRRGPSILASMASNYQGIFLSKEIPPVVESVTRGIPTESQSDKWRDSGLSTCHGAAIEVIETSEGKKKVCGNCLCDPNG